MRHDRLMSTLDFREITFSRGEGSWLFERESGRPYLDFFCDVGTSSLGYASMEQRLALLALYDGFVPLHSPNLYGHEARDLAAKRLCERTDMDKVFFCNSGAEAVEAAIKIARLWHYKNGDGRRYITSYRGGFHGRTLATLAAGDGPTYHREGFEPLPEMFDHFDSLADLEKLSSTPPAAVLLSPVFGNNDVLEYPDGWLLELQRWCEKHGTLLIFDEVQTGSGRSGLEYTYAQRLGLKPDIICLGKGVAMGVPVGACLARAPYSDTFTPGTHFSTFGGNPLCCTFVNGMLNWATPSHLGEVEDKGQVLREALARLPYAKNVRGVGMLCAFDLESDGIDFSKRCLDLGLLIGAFRRGPGPVKVTPPLNITIRDLDHGLSLMASVKV